MAIDGIGKGGAPPPAAGIERKESPTAAGVGSTGAEFKVGKTASSDAVANASLDRVRSGEISVGQYLDIKVSEATSHLEGRVNAEQLSFIRESLREQLSSDPVLVDLVKSTTGHLPPPKE
jgi:hypothetical protein